MNRLKKIFSLVLLLMVVATGCTAENKPKETTQEPVQTDKEVSQTEETSTADKDSDSESEKDPKNVMDQQEEGIKYVSADALNVRAEAKKDASILDSLKKGTRIKIVNETKDEEGTAWYEVSYVTTEEKKGFIAAEFTVATREELLGEDLRNLDFSPFEKIEYENNKKVKVRGVYVTIYAASGAKLDKLLELADQTDINAFVIDVKDDFGNMLFHTKAAEQFAPSANDKAPIKDIEAFTKKLKEKNIYLIARIVSFKDPTYANYNSDKVIINKETKAPFVNKDGIIWVSPHDRNLWNYNIEVAKEAAQAGFNEIQFDYVRFPASNGGKIDAMLDYRNDKNEGKPETIQKYLKTAYETLSKEQVYVAADVYGLVGSVPDDMQLGQYWEAVSNYVDYICPMMYPSHYGNNTYNIPIPDADPYGTVFHSAGDAVLRNQNLKTPAIIRPWIQSFTASWVKGSNTTYGPQQIKAQINALKDAGVDEYLLWNASNNYNIR